VKQYTVEEICGLVGGKLVGDPALVVSGVEEISTAQDQHLTFVGHKKFVEAWDKSDASAAIANDNLDIEPGPGRALIIVPDADLAMAEVLGLFAPAPPHCAPGIHATAVVDPSATIGEDVSIGAGCYVGPDVILGDGTRLYPNVTVLDGSQIGSGNILWSGAVVRERCRIGNNCIFHPNVTIGADGFGFRPSADGRGLVKVPQIGTVEIGNEVEIGSGSCVDRGKFSSTVIGDGTKIDNQVQIGHNCKMGRCCVMAGQSGLAGSVTLGDGVVIGGGARVRDHATVGSGVQIGGNATVLQDVEAGRKVLGTPADDAGKTIRQWAALKQLPDLMKKLKNLPE
jgi:UDP-3-O-[3-hydroxymyristoyl] glucosamine N-acyltransferase